MLHFRKKISTLVKQAFTAESFEKPYKIYYFITAALFFIVAVDTYIWGYDEHAALISHIELDNKDFRAFYLNEIKSYGVPHFLSNLILNFILPFIIVPLRWTYSIGISPLYEALRIPGISWQYLVLLIFFIHSFVSAVGLVLLTSSFKQRGDALLFFLSIFLVFLLSKTFSYWNSTFTSYSFHFIAFGSLVYSVRLTKSQTRRDTFSLNFFRAIPMMASYQYFPVVFMAGVLDMMILRTSFFRDRHFFGWIFPGLVGFLGLLLVRFRSGNIGSSREITKNFDQAQAYIVDFFGDSSFSDVIQFLASRLVDIVSYFFFINSHDDMFLGSMFSSFGWFGAILTLGGGVFFIFGVFRAARGFGDEVLPVVVVAVGIIVTQFTLYLFGILPMSPSRHSLILFLPLTCLSSIIVLWVFRSYERARVISCCMLAATVLFILGGRLDGVTRLGETDTSDAIACLSDSGAQQFVLESCFLEPVIHRRDIEFIYSCGPRDISLVKSSTAKVAVIGRYSSGTDWMSTTVGRYTDGTWSIDEESSIQAEECLDGRSDNLLDGLRFGILTRN
ncbi:hypothetical protein N9W66_11125 [Luminiphilus sp.]|nr:hypothetical protein [Luminiphilus sp.]